MTEITPTTVNSKNEKTFTRTREQWTSKFGFIVASVGAAIGLGNVWRFPYITGKYGGAAFLVVYVLAALFIAIPLLMTEFAIGRKTQLNYTGALRKMRPGTPWYLLGLVGVAVMVLVLSFYFGIAGWTLAYVARSVTGSYVGLTPNEIAESFGKFVSNPSEVLVWQIIVTILTAYVVIKGIKNGIEKWCKILLPTLFVFIVVLAVRSLTLPGAATGLSFYLKPDFSKLNPEAILAAMGQVFFTLSVGCGNMVIYGSYLSKKDTIGGTSLTVAAGDSLAAFLMGLVIFPAVFAFGLDPTTGPVLTFITLPSIFTQMKFGMFFATLFYLLLFMAAFTSTIALLEGIVGYVVDEWRWERKKTVIYTCIGLFILGIPSVLSFGPWSDFTPFFGKTFFDAIDFLVSNILLPGGGLIMAIFAGWVWGIKSALEEINSGEGMKVGSWYSISIKFIAPIAILFIMLQGLGIIHF